MNKNHMPQYCITARKFASENQSILFVLKNKKNNRTLVKTAAEISANKCILHLLSPEDALMVGYELANESFCSHKQTQKNVCH